MKSLMLPLILFFSTPYSVVAQDAFFKMLVQKEQALMDAIAVGDKAIWQAVLHDSCLITIEDGSFLTKEKFLEDLHPLPSNYKGMIKIIEPQLKQYGNTAVLTFVDDEYLELYGQNIHTQYRQMDTWIEANGDWKMIAMQLFEIPKNPPPLSISDKILSKYIGTYHLGSEKQCVITVKNGKIYAQKTGKEPVELFAETENVFFRKGDGRIRVIFLKDKKSNSYKMIERRAGGDVVWQEIK